MKKLNIFFIFILFNLSLFADITLNAPKSFIKGESYFFEFEAVGSSIKFPKIEMIDGNIVEDFGTSKSLQIINGNYNEKLSKKYRIIPKSNFTIPSFKFVIDGKDVYTNSQKVIAQKVKKTYSKNFDFTISASKKELYVGEEVVIKLVFKYKKSLQVTNLGFETPHFENFWYKKTEKSNNVYEQNGFVIHELEFILFPQKSAELNVGPLRIDVQRMTSSRSSNFSFFGTTSKLEKVYSNELKFNVKELPSGVNLIGNFDINASIDKKKIKLGESISYKLKVQGIGNLDDIDDIKLDIPNTTIYDNKPELNTKYTKNGYGGTYLKAFSIVPNNSLIIPSITLRYFSKRENKVVTKKTKEFNIEMFGEETKKVILEKSKEIIPPKEKIIIKKDAKLTDKIAYFVLGIIFALLIFGLISYVKLQKSKKQIKDTPLLKLVKQSKNKKSLMKVLIPFLKKESSLDKLIFECQESNKEFKILKKEILEEIKKIKL